LVKKDVSEVNEVMDLFAKRFRPAFAEALRAGRRPKASSAASLSPERARGGFTLIEVVVAIAILGIALTVIIELFAGGLRLARTSQEYTKAVNYANTKMEEVASRQTLEEGTTEGEFDEIYHWRVTLNEVKDLLPGEKPWEVKPPIQLFQIKVDISWKPGSKERSVGTETYRTMKVQGDEKKS
jgi:general secretion pathway protein I